jgi:hypothetical protein
MTGLTGFCLATSLVLFVLMPHQFHAFVLSAMGAVPATVLALPLMIGTGAVCFLQSMHDSVGVDAPTSQQIAQEKDFFHEHALFRHLPVLQTTLAWRKLGTFPTPIHKGECSARSIGSISGAMAGTGTDLPLPPPPAKKVSFFVKREDLSSPQYGGNKVRTLQHQLAVVEAKLERAKSRQRELVLFGSGGSNQVVATVVHSMQLQSKLAKEIPVVPLWMADPPDLDNTLNMLSTLSFHLGDFCTWSNPLALFATLVSKLIRGESFMLPLGGNNPTGVLGQAGGALELAEQIEAGIMSDCDGIYLPVGSSCTISGLILGVALSRRLGLNKAFSKPGFALHPVLIHDQLAALNRSFMGLYKSKVSRIIPLTIRHSLHATCRQLVKLGGPDVLAEALAILENETVLHDDTFVTGTYGVHSDASRACARLFDDSSTVTDLSTGETASGLWLCGHFTAKAMAVMCDDLLKDGNEGKNMLFWQTKSLVQPRGREDEWKRMQQMPSAVQQWAQQGQAESTVRPGKVDLLDGSAEDYRGLMTKIVD